MTQLVVAMSLTASFPKSRISFVFQTIFSKNTFFFGLYDFNFCLCATVDTFVSQSYTLALL